MTIIVTDPHYSSDRHLDGFGRSAGDERHSMARSSYSKLPRNSGGKGGLGAGARVRALPLGDRRATDRLIAEVKESDFK